VIFNDKPIGRHIVFLKGATRKLKGPVARPAVEVVVMSLSLPFIEGPKRWMRYAFQPPVSYKDLEVSVDRRLIERLHEPATVRKNFIHAQRPFMLPKDLLYGHSLCSITPQALILLS